DKAKVPVRVLRPEGLELVIDEGYSEPAIKEYKVDDRLQLIRYGFARIDSANDETYTLIYTHK
ncbi:MAG: hypothetical protein F7C33_05450, partial [Desulfurococcales archaeon]|nr:hypothetical protein [Desulfurococcales archaeon]